MIGMIRSKFLKIELKSWKFWVTVFILYTFIAFWPLLWWGLTSLSFKPNLVVFINENEARPCGGFATAVGEWRVLPPFFSFQNSYNLAQDLGPAPQILKPVAGNQKFWDLGVDTDPEVCHQKFEKAYTAITEQEVHQTILINASVLEDLLGQPSFFAENSRKVANIDRHDEAALAARKNILKPVFYKLIIRKVLNPFAWPGFAREVRALVDAGDIYVPGISPYLIKKEEDFAVIEWNLGGGKSSRYLDKKVVLKAIQNKEGEWNMYFDFSAHHLGSYDEPLSQDWKGVFEIHFPTFTGISPQFFPAEIKPGGTFEKSLSFSVKDHLTSFGFLSPRGQEIFAEVKIQAFGQNRIIAPSNSLLRVRENRALARQSLKGKRIHFDFEVLPDQIAPFVTLHEVIGRDITKDLFVENQQKYYFYAEIHFNEPVILKEDFKVDIVDRSVGQKSIIQNPSVEATVLLEDKRTLLLQLTLDQFQKDERFGLLLEGVEDRVGNALKTAQRTLITR